MTPQTKEWAAVTVAVVLLTAVSVAALVTLRDTPSNTPTLAIAGCAPQHPASAQVHVSLNDGGAMMGGSSMMVSLGSDVTTVPAGKVTFIATNYGQLVHELLILPLPADGPGTRAVRPDGKIDETSSLGEASRSCGQGVGDGITPGARSWVTVSLTPGTYELLCDQPWHYADGMFGTVVAG